MAAAPKKSKNAPGSLLRISGGTIIQTTRSDMFIVRVGKDPVSTKKVASDQLANTLLPKMGKAFSRPGVDRQSVFQSNSGKTVYAYSMDPRDPSRIIKEDQSGKQTIGRMATDGTFRAARSKAA
jgi:hypothetical protein